jgi:hypothetical protein
MQLFTNKKDIFDQSNFFVDENIKITNGLSFFKLFERQFY